MSFFTSNTTLNWKMLTDLFVENRFGLTTETRLLAIVTPFTLCEERRLASFVLGDLVQGVLLALLACAEGLASLRDVHHLQCFEGRLKSTLLINNADN